MQTTFGQLRPPFVALLGASLIFSGLVLAERNRLLSLPGPSDELVAAILPGAVIARTNEERSDKGLGTLKASALLNQAAQMKANDMAEKSYYAHVSPDGTLPPAWLDRVGYRYEIMGENLVVDRDTSDQVVSAWMGSPSHRENMLNPAYTEIGIGVAHGIYKDRKTIYVVEMLAKPVKSTTPAPRPIAKPTAPVKPTQPLLPKPEPVRTAATNTPIVRAPTPKPVVKDTIKPVLEAVASSTLVEVPSIVASTTYTPPIVPPFVSPPIELAPPAAEVAFARPSLRASVRSFVDRMGVQLRNLFNPIF